MRKRNKDKLIAHNEDYAQLLNNLNVTAQMNHELLQQALTHSSYLSENEDEKDYERLEFLGDSLLGFVAADLLFTNNPTQDQAVLSRRRAAIINTKALAFIARKYDIGSYLRLGKGEAITSRRDRDSVLEDALEAIIGAVYVDQGIQEARALVERLLAWVIDDESFMRQRYDYKSKLQVLAAEFGEVVEYYGDYTAQGEQEYTATASVKNLISATATAASKREAERQAAQNAVEGYYFAKGETIDFFAG